MTMDPAADPCLSLHSAETNTLTHIACIPNAGRGVLASQPIPSGTVVLHSKPASAGVIFRNYRKEVCARCFRYDLGRTLAVRHASTGKFFCSEACRHEWLEGEGELGVRAWESLSAFVQARVGKGGVDDDGEECLPDRGSKPSESQIEAAWDQAAAEVASRCRPQSGRKARPATKTTACKQPIDLDILSYLLSSILSHHQRPETWHTAIATLALDPEPYRSQQDLLAHITSYQHLCAIMPKPLLPSCVPSICHLAVSGASHNSFGIRSPEDGGAEYMGYALFPDASYFNHSCRPNIRKVRVDRQWVFTADRDIGMGEECCITYLGGDEKDLDVGERRARLKEHWGFVCMCGRCCEESSVSS